MYFITVKKKKKKEPSAIKNAINSISKKIALAGAGTVVQQIQLMLAARAPHSGVPVGF